MFRKEDEGKRSSLTHFQTEEVPSTFLVSIFLPPLTFSGNPAALCHCFSGAHSHKPCQRQIPVIWGGKGSPTVRDWLYPQEMVQRSLTSSVLNSGNQNSQQKSSGCVAYLARQWLCSPSCSWGCPQPYESVSEKLAFFSHKLSFNGRKILCIRGGLAEMEECVCPLKLPERNRDCRWTKRMLSPLCQPALPPPLKKKKYSPELDCCHSNSIAESHYSTPHYVMAEEVGECCLNGIKFGGNHRLMAGLHWALQTDTAWDSQPPCTFSQPQHGSHTTNRVPVCFASLGIAPEGHRDTNSIRKRVSKHKELVLCIWPWQ